MRLLRTFLRDEHGVSAAEFALVAPLMILFLLGIIDVGRFIWNVNQAEKATQIGARWAVATDMIPSDLYSYSFATEPGTPVTQGTVVPASYFPGVKCTSSGCECASGGTCNFGLTSDSSAFTALVGRMNQIYGGIGSSDVEVDYGYSGLGYAGDPNGPDVDPLVTVKTTGLSFKPIFLAGIFDWGLPNLSYTLTAEDSQGTFSN